MPAIGVWISGGHTSFGVEACRTAHTSHIFQVMVPGTHFKCTHFIHTNIHTNTHICTFIFTILILYTSNIPVNWNEIKRAFCGVEILVFSAGKVLKNVCPETYFVTFSFFSLRFWHSTHIHTLAHTPYICRCVCK